MVDALECANKLAEAKKNSSQRDWWNVGIAAYEAEMFPRAAAAAQESATNMELVMGPGAPASIVDLFKAAGPPSNIE